MTESSKIVEKLLAAKGNFPQDELLDLFLAFMEEKGVELYPAQEDAILELMEGRNVILSTPTGSGKSLVASAMHFRGLGLGRKSYYTCPIKALVNEKFLALCQEYGPEQVGLMTGDASVNTSAPIICATAEILANIALREGSLASIDDVVMDEFHFYSDRDRGMAWQVPLLTMPQSRFLLMSATLGDTSFFQKELEQFTGEKVSCVSSKDRPVPLDFKYEEYPLEHTLERLVSGNKVPIYVVHFTQREVAQTAQGLLSVNYCDKEEKKAIRDEIGGFSFRSPYGKEIRKLLTHGVGIHHAGLLPKYRLLVEKLAQKGMLKIICGTDTLGVGINIPLRTVVFTKLCKYDGEKTRILTVRDFHQIAGRAGRKGFDDSGSILVMAPAHVIENKASEAKAKKKGKKVVKSKPPEKGFVNWNNDTFEKLLNDPPEVLTSSFKLNHAVILNVLSRTDGGCEAMKNLIRNCHENAGRKKRLVNEGFVLLRTLLDRKIVSFAKNSAGKSYVQVNQQLQDNFSLDQTLSLFLLDIIQEFDPDSEGFALAVLTAAESIVENPKAILLRQEDKVKKNKLLEMKQMGMDFDERMEELDKITYPKPMSSFLYDRFNVFAKEHVWIGQDNIRPKSILREMYEECESFSSYVQSYGLERMEGLLLRYLSQVYKVLIQTIPESIRSEEVMDIITFVKDAISITDSSLLDEWEKLKDPVAFTKKQDKILVDEEQRKSELGILYDMDVFYRLVRNKCFRFVRMLANEQYAETKTLIENGKDWGVSEVEEALIPYYDIYESILLNQDARSNRHAEISKGNDSHLVLKQTLLDPEGNAEFMAIFDVLIEESKLADEPILMFRGVVQI
ncbi:DUF3516 domain-containing protein [Bacteriovoracaceae bacterium]|nr:DUF3516 domain-containing protein [Bacteriovoracaceae bacterium]